MHGQIVESLYLDNSSSTIGTGAGIGVHTMSGGGGLLRQQRVTSQMNATAVDDEEPTLNITNTGYHFEG